MLIKVPDERQFELDSLQTAASQPDAAVAEVRAETLAEVTKMRSERNSAASRNH